MGRSILALLLLLGALLLGWLKLRDRPSAAQPSEMPRPAIFKQPVNFASRTFDPASPPSDMPPLPAGEAAQCDSDFQSSARVGEQGHRQISETYYQAADKVAERIAARYMGKQTDIEGADLNAEANQMLQQMAAEITDAYNKELNPNPAQLLYDSITDHARNEVAVQDAVAHALKNVSIEFNSGSQPR